MPSDSQQHAVLIVNARSRRGSEWFDEAREWFATSKWKLVDSKLLEREDEMSDELSRARQAEIPLIVVGGGDGTLRIAASRLAHSKSVLGVLPMGTGNAFARDLGIPTHLERACEILESGTPRAVDIGYAAGQPFLSLVTVGVSNLVARGLDSAAKKRWGPLAYLAPVVRAFRLAKPFRARIIAEGIEESFPCLQIVVGNGTFHAGRFPLPIGSSLRSGELSMYAIATKEKHMLYRYMVGLVLGRVEELRESRVYSMRSCRIETRPAKRATIDGEPGGMTPIDLTIDPGALLTMGPSSEPE